MAKQNKKKAEQIETPQSDSPEQEAEELQGIPVDMDLAVDPGDASSDDELAALKRQLEEVSAQAEENLDGWQRAQAEFSNYKKRMERNQTQFYQDTTGHIIKRYLEIVDDLDRALKNKPEDAEGADWAQGIELIFRKLFTILDNEGVKPMQAAGQFFDPNLHEAISQEDSPEHESGQIIEVIQQGYLLGERVLRPALVRIAS
ncbi:MAG: nucleotide exchange factor GrpE [Anaerolineae bacterium]|nr:nucleotide exchange factor GrpE [Anaerolineae bacterium]